MQLRKYWKVQSSFCQSSSLILFSKYLSISQNKGRISEAHLSVGGSQPSFQPTHSFFENWKDVHVFETLPAAPRPDSWCAQIPPFSGGKKKKKGNQNREPKMFWLILCFYTVSRKRRCRWNTSVKNSVSNDISWDSAPKHMHLEPTWSQRLHFIWLPWNKELDPHWALIGNSIC